MNEDKSIKQKEKHNNRLTGEKLNFIIAICAILISAASFYATYLQADAANKQVKAMTLPMVQYEHGNANSRDEAEINFSLVNAGVGPAMIKSAAFTYKGNSYNSLFNILSFCCKQAAQNFQIKTQNPEIKMPQNAPRFGLPYMAIAKYSNDKNEMIIFAFRCFIRFPYHF